MGWVSGWPMLGMEEQGNEVQAIVPKTSKNMFQKGFLETELILLGPRIEGQCNPSVVDQGGPAVSVIVGHRCLNLLHILSMYRYGVILHGY